MIRHRYLLTFLFWSMFAIKITSENVTIHLIDRDDFDFNNVITTVMSQEEAKTKFKTLVLVYDKYLKKCIGGWGSYDNIKLSKSDYKKIVKDSIFDLYNDSIQIRTDNKLKVNNSTHSILGLHWGMLIEDAIIKLKNMGITSYIRTGDYHITYMQEVYWDGVLFDNVRLSFFMSNNQNKYLSDITFIKICTEPEDAKKIQDIIALNLSSYYGVDAVKEQIGNNKFKEYKVYEQIKELGDIKQLSVKLDVKKIQQYYIVGLNFYGWLQTSKYVNE